MGPCVEDIVVRNSMVQSQFNLDTPFKIYFLVLSFIGCGMIYLFLFCIHVLILSLSQLNCMVTRLIN